MPCAMKEHNTFAPVIEPEKKFRSEALFGAVGRLRALRTRAACTNIRILMCRSRTRPPRNMSGYRLDGRMPPVKARVSVHRDCEYLPSGTPACCPVTSPMAWHSVLMLGTAVPRDTICPTVEGVVTKSMPAMVSFPSRLEERHRPQIVERARADVSLSNRSGKPSP